MFMRVGQGGGDLRGVAERLVDRQRAIFQPVGDGVAFEQFHHQVVGADVVKRADVGMIQRRNRTGLALEAGAEPLVGELDGDGPAEARVDGAKDFAHATLAEFAFHLVGSQASAGVQHGHRRIAGQLGGAVEDHAIVLAREERFDFAAQFGIGLREQSGALAGGGFPRRNDTAPRFAGDDPVS